MIILFFWLGFTVKLIVHHLDLINKMGAKISSYFSPQPKIKAILTGLDAAGKTTVLYRLSENKLWENKTVSSIHYEQVETKHF